MSKEVVEFNQLIEITKEILLFTHISVDEINHIFREYGAENKGFCMHAAAEIGYMRGVRAERTRQATREIREANVL